MCMCMCIYINIIIHVPQSIIIYILTLSKSTTQEGSGPPKIRYTYVTAFNFAYCDAFSDAKLCVVPHFL